MRDPAPLFAPASIVVVGARRSPASWGRNGLSAVALRRRRVQHTVDRRFNRACYDAGQTVAAFAASLKDAVDLDSIRDDLAGAVHQALEPAHISIWVSRRA